MLTARRGVNTAGELDRYVVKRNCSLPASYLEVSILELDQPD